MLYYVIEVITIRKKDKEIQTFYVGKNVYDNNDTNDKKQDKVGFKDILAMTIALYKLIFPIIFIVILFFVILFYVIF